MKLLDISTLIIIAVMIVVTILSMNDIWFIMSLVGENSPMYSSLLIRLGLYLGGLWFLLWLAYKKIREMKCQEDIFIDEKEQDE